MTRGFFALGKFWVANASPSVSMGALGNAAEIKYALPFVPLPIAPLAPPPGGGTAAEERDDAPSGSEAPVNEDGAEEGEAVGDQGARGSSPPPVEVAAEADEPEQ